jgi:hypothetical protein
MNGPSKSDIEQPGKHFDWMECGIIFAGVLVVVGLLLESWPELKLAVCERRFPNVTVTGGIIVTVGVLLEVVLGIFITQRANRAQSEANERVARAEQATAEANLARVKLETTLLRRTLHRYLDTEEEKELAKALSEFAGQTFTAVEARFGPESDLRDDLTTEKLNFVGQLERILTAAGWKQVRLAFADYPVVRGGVKIFMAEKSAQEAGRALHLNLAKLLIVSEPRSVPADKIRSLIEHGPVVPSHFENPVVLPILIAVGSL